MKPQILIVDDEPFMHRLIGATLRKGGFEFTTCRTGEEALATAAREVPSLIIMDLMMPGRDGLATTRDLKAAPTLCHVPVIMLTAKGHRLMPLEAEQSGVAVFLTKPFSPTQLLADVRRLLAP